MSVLFNQTNLAPGTSWISTINVGGGGGSNFPNGLTAGVVGGGGAVFGMSSMVANYNTSNNPSWIPVRLNYNPVNANINDVVGMLITYNPDTAGQTALFMGAYGTGEAVLGAVWEGYITMPLLLYGATIKMVSDNETFLYMDGNAGAIGNISTGVQFNSASNILNTITDPTKQYTADTTALFSTLKDLYPSCFL